jgi:hypothetical protein
MTEVDEIVRSVAASGLEGAASSWPTASLNDDAWDRLLRVVRDQRLAGLLVQSIDGGALPATDAQYAQARVEHALGVGRVLLIERDALAVLAVLSAAGVRARVLKGPAVAHLDYPDPALRLYVDLDLIVPSAEFDRAVAALTAAGRVRWFRQPRPGFDQRFSKGTSFVSPEQPEIDLHRTFVMGPFGLRVRLDDVWGTGSTFRLGEVDVEGLAPDLRFLHACFHAALGDVVPRLVPQRDVAQMLQNGNLDLARVHLLMRSWQAEAVVARAVSHTWRTLRLSDGSPLADWALRYRPSARSLRELTLYTDPKRSYASMSLAALRAVPGLRDKAAFAFALTFPDRSYVDGRYAGPWARWWWALRAVTRGRRVESFPRDRPPVER